MDALMMARAIRTRMKEANGRLRPSCLNNWTLVADAVAIVDAAESTLINIRMAKENS